MLNATAEAALTVPCIRCGTFVARRLALGPRLAVCARCSVPAQSKPDPLLISLPPPWLVWRRSVVFAVVTALALFVLDLPALYRFVVRGWSMVFPELGRPELAAGAALALTLACHAAFLVIVLGWDPSGSARWKRETLETLGFRAGHIDALTHVLFCERPPALFDVRIRSEPGLLAVGPEGLAFFGASHRRFQIRAQRIVASGEKNIWLLWPPRLAVELTLADGTKRYFAPLERSYTANAVLARALVQRLQPK